MAFGDLITLNELKVAMGISLTEVDPVRDAKLESAITDGSQAARDYADRNFGLPLKTEVKEYEYDSSGYLDIDDAHKINSVEFKFGESKFPVTNFYYRAEPQAGPPYTYITIPRWAGIYSPEMGFRYNLDVIAKDRGWPGLIPLVAIEAEWGWEEVPRPVKRAVIYIAAKLQQKPGQLVSEHIADYSYVTQLRGVTGDPSVGSMAAIPPEAQDLLAPYVRFQV